MYSVARRSVFELWRNSREYKRNGDIANVVIEHLGLEDCSEDISKSIRKSINPMVNCSKEVESGSEVTHLLEPIIKKEMIDLENESLDADEEMETVGTNFVAIHLEDVHTSTSPLNMGGDPAETQEAEGDDPLGTDVGCEGSCSCRHCEKVFTSEAELKEHLVMVHKEKVGPRKTIKGVYPCPHCGKAFCYPSKLNNHLVCHRNDKQYFCDVCLKRYARLSDMHKHRSRHIGAPALKRDRKVRGQYWCFECNMYFEWPSSLKNHLQIHETKKTLCTLSDHISTSTSNKSEDPAETQETEGDYPLVSYIGYEGKCFCRYCDEVLSGESKLKKHLVKLHKDKVGPCKQIRGVYPCPHCDQTFWIPSRLNQHLWRHSKKKRYSCDICLEGFTRNKYMYNHRSRHFVLPGLMRVQELKGEYRCFDCNKVFQWQSELKAHLQATHF